MDPITAGLITTGITEIVFRSENLIIDQTKKILKPTLSKTYEKVLIKVEKKYPKSRPTINRIFKTVRVKQRFVSPRGGREEILTYVKNFGVKSLKKRDAKLPIEKIIDDFYRIFIAEVKNDPSLSKKLMEAYFSELMTITKGIESNTKLIPEMYALLLETKKTMAEALAEKSIFKKMKGSGFPFRQGAFQINVYGVDINQVESILEASYNVINKKGTDIEKAIEIVDESDDKNSLKFLYHGELFKVIYPTQDSTVIWLTQHKNYVEFTAFVANFQKRDEIIGCIKSYLSPVAIKEITFDKKMIEMVKKYLGNITHLKYNPKIQHKVKIKNIIHTIKGKIGIFGGDPGFLKNKEISPIIEKLKPGGKKKITDVYFFKCSSLFGIHPSGGDFDFHRDGRIVGHFSRKKLNKNLVRKSLYKFIITHGKEY